MPRLDGLEATRELHADPDPPRVIVLTTFDADEHVVGALAAGADGFLLKDTPPAADRRRDPQGRRRRPDAVAVGDPHPDRPVRTDRRRPTAPAEAPSSGSRSLTEREREVALAVGRGLSNAEIAAELYLSVPTVKAHVSRLFEKLGVTNRVQIAICVHDAGLRRSELVDRARAGQLDGAGVRRRRPRPAPRRCRATAGRG